ncbi:uncharacterized protein LOC127257462 isoform X2 [Andrographis paniculata]|uniref:uncharacterized protein LOC127257462 isoform X2 n=1 Tax=Andrographis paniculata TaxID=175694 RepID=UPI0021E6DE53|nr:uncharacterized protein LOC127257462 isoform X2 [Andrographis paniculata]
MSSKARFIMSSFARLTRHPFNPVRALPLSRAQELRHRRIYTPTRGFEHRGYSQNYNNIGIRSFYVYGSTPGTSLPSVPPSSSPLNWILGIILSIILPFFGIKMGPLLQFKREVDTAVKTVEEVVEVVEKVAEVVDKVAEDVSDHLPEGGKLKKVAEAVEVAAEETAKDAYVVGNAIDKFQEVEEKVENLVGTMEDHQDKVSQNSQRTNDSLQH